MKAKHSVWKNKLAKTMFLLAVVSVAALFIVGAASAAVRPGETKTQNNNTIAALNKSYTVRTDGLAPQSAVKYTPSQQPALDRGYFYAYCAYSGPGIGPVTFDTPDALTLLAPGIFPNFAGGADIDSDVATGIWYGCDYAGGLYEIDRDTGTQTYIAPTIGVNGMTFDGDTWYVSSSNSLYSMDVATGATTLIGSHGITNTMIGIACNLDGDMYGYDVLWTGDSTLYSIDKSTGAATAIGPMGYGMVYAQDCGFDRDNDVLYIAAYYNDGAPSALMTCDVSTGACTPIGNFQGGAEIDGFAVPWMGVQYDHDIAISGIVKPATGNAGPITPVVKVKNSGLNTETNVPVQMLIGKELITGTLQDFEATNGSYIHFAKNTDSWQWGVPTSGPGAAHSGSNLWATILNGNYPSSMWSGLMTQPFVVPSGAMFKFWQWYQFESGWDGGNVKISTDGGSSFTLITPVGGYPGTLSSNPYMNGQPGYTGTGGTTWAQAVFDLSAFEGMTVVILWETASDSSVQYAGWYIDDVGFTETSWVNEYTQTAYVSTIAPDEVVELSFPTWTPGDLGLVENNNINYNVEATAMLVGDQNLNNDYKEKAFSLHYGYFHDVAVTQIVSPADGLAETQIPEVVIENHGQNAESVNVQMTIGKAIYTTLIEEDFAGGVPPAGWGTNYPSNWISSSTNYAGGTAPEASFSWSPSSVGEHYLWTGVIDTTGYTALSLKFKEYVNDYNGGYTLKVVTSTDGGATWSDAYVRAGGPYGPTTTEVTLTAANGIGSATFQVAWDMSGDSFNINYWYIDDVWMGIIDMVDEYDQTVTIDVAAGASGNAILPAWTPSDIPFSNQIDYLVNVEATLNGFVPVYTYGFEEAWIPAIPPGPPVFPPTGWAVYNVNGYNTWVQSSSGQRTGSYAAKCSYDYMVMPNDDWLVTKGTVVAPGGVFSIWIDGYSYSDDEFEIYMSTTGNTPADFYAGTLLQGVYYPVPTVYTQYTFDMSAYVGMTVYFGVRYIGYNAWYIWADDITFPDGSFEGFEGGTPGVPGHWPSFNQYVYGTTTDQWTQVTSGTYPTCTPPEGTYMAKYGSYSISSGSAELDGTVLIDFSAATQMKFKMMHDTGYSTSTDVIYPLLSADGVNFWYDGTAYYRYDGTTGWKTETMDYSFLINYLGGPGNYYIGFYAVSDYGNNMFIDDINVMEFSSIADGYPADNSLGAIVTLSYEHDAGVVVITQPSGSAPKDEGWLQYDNGVYSNAFGSTTGHIYGANRFTVTEQTPFLGYQLDMIRWKHYGAVAFSGTVHVFSAGTTTAPGAEITSEPFSITGEDWFEVPLTTPVTLDGSDIWLCVEGTHLTGEYPLECSAPGITLKTAYFSSDGATWYDLPGLGYDVAFEIRGHVQSGGGPSENWLPGTYPVEGIIQNMGVTYSESDIPVNAQITNDTGVIVYDETIIVAGPLAPGATAVATFPTITIPSEPAAEGDYKLTMKTVLPGDDHPNNDKKTLTWIIQIPDTTPPVTTATVSGTMGQNGWYVSNVQVTLTAEDFKWPMGVDYTMYKVDNGDWLVYSTPIIVDTDGAHTVYFYSVDKAVPPNTEETKNVTFKMDKTAPVINEFTATAQNTMKNKWLLECDATDVTSGIVLVEFYADDALVGSVTAAPYSFEVDGKIHTAQCIVYDAAGNSKMSDVVNSYEVEYQQYSLLQQKIL